MSKPSLMQTLLNRPSQTYSFPQEKEYFSNKTSMLRLAAESGKPHAGEATTSSSAPRRSFNDGGLSDAETSQSTYGRRPPSSTHTRASDSTSSLGRVLPANEIPSSDTQFTTYRSRNNYDPKRPNHSAKKPSSPSHRSQQLSEPFDDPNDSDSSQDVFYTPNTSPRTSMASSVLIATIPFPSQAGRTNPSAKTQRAATTHENQPSSKQRRSQPSTPPSSSVPSVSSASLTSTTMTTSVGGHTSSTPSNLPSKSTKTNTPVQSADGHAISFTRNLNKQASKASTTKRVSAPHDPSATVVKATITKKAEVLHAGHPSSIKLHDKSAQDVRLPSDTAAFTSTRNAMNTSDKMTPEIGTQSANGFAFAPDPSSFSAKSSSLVSRDMNMNPPRKSKKPASKVSTNNTIGMAALLEEDEDTMSTRSIRTIIEEDKLLPTGSSAEELPLPQHLRRRRSRSLDYSPSRSPSKFERKYVPPSDYHGGPSALPSHGTRGYTSLTLPRAPPPPSMALGLNNVEGKMRLDGSGKIDLTKSGIAQTTMATVEVVRGLGHKYASSKGWRVVKEIFYKRTAGISGMELGFTSYRAPPSYVPARSILVQVWAVAMDGVDMRLLRAGDGVQFDSTRPTSKESAGSGWLKRRTTVSQRRHNDDTAEGTNVTDAQNVYLEKSAEVGYIPGRSFVGRILECGWEVQEEVLKRGDWIAGLLDARKCGGLAEFILVDRHRAHRVPYPYMGPIDGATQHDTEQGMQSIDARLNAIFPRAGPSTTKDLQQSTPARTPSRTPSTRSSSATPRNMRASPSRTTFSEQQYGMSIEELALLPLTGIPAYRAVRTFQFACASWEPDNKRFPSSRTIPNTSHSQPVATMSNGQVGRRVVVIKGQDGVGAMAVQMLVKKGWRVCVHAPLPQVIEDEDADSRREEEMRIVEERARVWGAEEVIFDDGGFDNEGLLAKRTGPVVRVLQRLLADGDVFDAVLDTVGGKEIWEASEKLLSVKRPGGRRGQFTTLVGDNPERPIPTAGDHFRAGIRNWRFGGNRTRKGSLGRSTSLNVGHSDRLEQISGPADGMKGKGKIGYAWVSLVQDVDWEGEDVGESLGVVLRMALEDGIRPFVTSADPTDGENPRRIRFEKAPEVLGDKSGSTAQILEGGGSVVVKIVE